MKLEAKIGLFVLMGLTALFFLSTQVTKLGKWNQDNYYLYANIDDASGLELQSKVSMNGVNVGEVSHMAINGRSVKLTLSIHQQVAIPADTSLIILQESMLGAKMINLLAGKSPEDLAPGDEIKDFKRYASFDRTSDSVNAAARQLELLMRDLREVLGETQKTEIKEIITAFRDIGNNLNTLIVENRAGLRNAVDNMSSMGEGFTATANTINADLPKILARIDSITGRLDSMSVALEDSLPEAVDKFLAIEDNVTAVIEENRESLNNALTSADGFFSKGEEAFDKVDSLLSNFTISELQVSFQGDYMVSDEYIKVDIGIIYLPNPETYYMLDLITRDDYSNFDANGNPADPAKHEDSDVLFSAQYGKRFDNFLMRGGVIESTGGIGFDIFADHDRFLLSYDLFDINAQNDVRGTDPHMTVGARYRFLKHFEVYGGWDNFLNSDADNIYFGVGFRFIDNNLKYVLGTSTMAL